MYAFGLIRDLAGEGFTEVGAERNVSPHSNRSYAVTMSGEAVNSSGYANKNPPFLVGKCSGV